MKVPTKTGFAHYTAILTGLLLLLTMLAACGDTNPTSAPATIAPVTATTGSTAAPATTAANTTSASTPTPATTAANTTSAATTTANTPVPATNTPIPNVNIPFSPTAKATAKTGGKAVLGTPFALKINETALIASENIEVKFLKVLEDSRCPVNVNCVWSGQIIAQVAVTKNGKAIGSFNLNNIEAFKNKDKQVFEDYALTLVKAEPGRVYTNFAAPNATITDTKSEDYVLSFLLAKVSGASATPTAGNGGVGIPANGTVLDVKMNQTVTLAADNIEVKLLRVLKDERCPVSGDPNISVACSFSGPVVIEVAIAKDGQALGNFQLSSGDAFNNKNKKLFDNYALTIYQVKPNRIDPNPGPNSSKVIEVNPADYVISLLAVKVG